MQLQELRKIREMQPPKFEPTGSKTISALVQNESETYYGIQTK